MTQVDTSKYHIYAMLHEFFVTLWITSEATESHYTCSTFLLFLERKLEDATLILDVIDDTFLIHKQKSFTVYESHIWHLSKFLTDLQGWHDYLLISDVIADTFLIHINKKVFLPMNLISDI